METKAQELLKNASTKLFEANKELMRPEEDVVSFVICKNAQFAIENYLKGYLFKNGFNADNLQTIEELHKECININPKFKNVDLSEINCKSGKTAEKYCYEVSKVSKCFDVANSLDTLLKEEKVI